jgi:hypothetical protein
MKLLRFVNLEIFNPSLDKEIETERASFFLSPLGLLEKKKLERLNGSPRTLVASFKPSQTISQFGLPT